MTMGPTGSTPADAMASFEEEPESVDLSLNDALDTLPLLSRGPLTSPSMASLHRVTKKATTVSKQPEESTGIAIHIGGELTCYGSEEDSMEAVEFEMDPVPSHELQKILTFAYPVVLTSVLEMAPCVICVVLVGHLDSPKTKQFLDATALSTMFSNITSLSIGFGLASALDTLCSQAFGAGKLMKMGIYFQTGFLVIALCLVPMFVLNWNCGYLLQLLGQDPEVSRLAGEYSRITVFSAPFLFFYELNRKVLQAQNITNPMLCIAIIGNLVTVAAGWWLTYKTSMGFRGAALAITLSDVVMTLCLVPYYLQSSNHKLWWPGWKLRKAAKSMKSFLRLGIPGMLMVAMEWWAYEMMAFMTGLLPDSVVSVSAYAVLTQITATLYMVYFGISVAGSIRVGNALGANLPRKAALISRLTVAVVVCVGCLAALFLFVFRDSLPGLLTNDKVAIQRAAQCLLVMVPFELIDGTNCVLQGIFRGTGKQRIAAIINGVAFYIVGIPVAAMLAFRFELSVEGLWIGMSFGITCAIVACITILRRSSWSQMAQEAQERMTH